MNRLSQQDRQTLDNYTGMTVGQIFHRARETHGYNIMDIAAHLNIASTHLEAIEADDIKSLPPKVYAVGFVRAYADLLGLDSEKMAYLFKVQFYGKNQVEQEKEMTRPEGKTVTLQETIIQKSMMLPLIIGGGVLALIILGIFLFVIAWLLTPSDKSGQIKVPEVPAELAAEAPPPEDILDSAEPETAEMPIEPIDIVVRPDEGGTVYGVDPLESALALKMTDESWLEIRELQSGKLLLTRTLDKGDVFYAREDQDILLTTGNAGGVEMFLDGQSLGVLGNKAEIIRARPLSVEALRLREETN